MGRTRVIVLSPRSLFAEGVASRLRQHVDQIDLHTIDSREPDALTKVIAMRPDAVILDATDTEIERLCPLKAMLEALPTLKILRLDPQHEHVHVVTSEQHPAGEIGDLISLIHV
ncbi:MAG TPA: hypothetical protein VIK33_16385 [Anaerolineae bacterium]